MKVNYLIDSLFYFVIYLNLIYLLILYIILNKILRKGIKMEKNQKALLIGSVILLILIGTLIYLLKNEKQTKEPKLLNKQKIEYKDNSIKNFENDSIREDIKLELNEKPTLEYLNKHSEYVGVFKIISADGVEVDKENGNGFTVGKMLVLKSFKGNLKEGDIVNYRNIGGVFEFEEYKKGFSKGKLERFKSRLKEANEKEPKYIETHYEMEKKAEIGKTYLMYLNKKNNKYEVESFYFGIREIKDSQDRRKEVTKNELLGEFSRINKEEIEVLNNEETSLNHRNVYDKLSDIRKTIK